MPNNNWIKFPKNPYEGQIFYYPATKDTFTYIIPKGQSEYGQWVLISYNLFMNFKNGKQK